MSEVTGREEMYYPTSKTTKKIFMVSVPVTIACLRYILQIDFILANRLGLNLIQTYKAIHLVYLFF